MSRALFGRTGLVAVVVVLSLGTLLPAPSTALKANIISDTTTATPTPHAAAPRTPPPVGDDWFGWQLQERDDRFNAFLSHIQSHMMPRFTPRGFAVADAPPALHAALRARLLAYGDETPQDDGPVNLIGVTKEGQTPPGFIPNHDLNQRTHRELLPLCEAWSGQKLEPTAVYGLRVYRRGAALLRHVDRVETHIISAILHIDRDEDAAPWPLVIEDHDGVEHSVELQPGQLLFYESAKMPHARPSAFEGRFYCSVFVHFRPVGWNMTHEGTIAHLPDDWARGTVSTPLESVSPKTFNARLRDAIDLRPPPGMPVGKAYVTLDNPAARENTLRATAGAKEHAEL